MEGRQASLKVDPVPMLLASLARRDLVGEEAHPFSGMWWRISQISCRSKGAERCLRNFQAGGNDAGRVN